MMAQPPEEIAEFAPTKEQVLAARKRDASPLPPKPEHRTISLEGGDADKGGDGRGLALSLHVLGSGSKGNCIVVSGPFGAVMVDCGFNRRETARRLALAGIDPSLIRGIVITHEHIDHILGADVVSRWLDVPVIATAPTFDARSKLSVISNRETIAAGDAFTVAGICIETFSTSHDVVDPIGMRLTYDGCAVGLATDTGFLSDEALATLHDVDVLALESNHDPTMLKTGPYPSVLKARVGGDLGHLSNAQSAEYLGSLLDGRIRCVVGMHLSQVNNTPEKALAALTGAAEHSGCDVAVAVADQSRSLSVV